MKPAMEMKLSVIVGVYNPPLEKFATCIESIINQSYANLEIILLDDGSSNGAECACDRYLAQDKRIKVVHQKNYGTHAKFHIGYTLATGDYLTNVDHDDFLEPDLYERLMQEAHEHGADVVDSGYYHHDWRTKTTSQKFIDSYFKIEGQEQIVVASTKGTISTETWCRVFKRELAKSGDQWLLADPLTFIGAKTLIHIPYAGYHFVNVEGSSSSGRLSGYHVESLERFVNQQGVAATLKVYPFLKGYVQRSLIAWLERCYYYVTRTSKPLSDAEKALMERMDKHLQYKKEVSKGLPASLRLRYFAVTHRLVYIPYKLVTLFRRLKTA